jgi:hypothetical protein
MLRSAQTISLNACNSLPRFIPERLLGLCDGHRCEDSFVAEEQALVCAVDGNHATRALVLDACAGVLVGVRDAEGFARHDLFEQENDIA